MAKLDFQFILLSILKKLCCLIFLWIFFQDSIVTRKIKRTAFSSNSKDFGLLQMFLSPLISLMHPC